MEANKKMEIPLSALAVKAMLFVSWVGAKKPTDKSMRAVNTSTLSAFLKWLFTSTVSVKNVILRNS